MTTPGGSSPLRVGGFALLGVAVVAGIIGLAALVLGGNGTGSQAAAPTPTAAAEPPVSAAPSAEAGPAEGGAPSVVPPGATTVPGDGSVPVPSFAPDATAPPSSAPVTGGGADRGAAPVPTPTAPLRVYNSSGIDNLAANAAADFRAAGWTVTAVDQYPGTIPTSTVYYRLGTSEQAPAQALASQFGLRSKPRFEGIQDASPGVIVIVAQDYRPR